MKIKDIEKAILMMDEGKSISEIAKHFNISTHVLKLAIWPFIKRA